MRVQDGQRLHAHCLVVAPDKQNLAIDHLVGEPLQRDDARVGARGVVWRLMEQYDTGVLPAAGTGSRTGGVGARSWAGRPWVRDAHGRRAGVGYARWGAVRGRMDSVGSRVRRRAP